jgi:beta-1,4-mannosyl-glycoprotein beta-1,4-N-acetylglucosaminyltransferase
MAIYDCFQFFNENLILDIRLNILNEKVDYFVVSECVYDHQGKKRSLNFDLNNFKKFKNKIIYIVVDKVDKKYLGPNYGPNSLIEQTQRNSIFKGLKNANADDLIIISDVDEIPDLRKLGLYNSKNYGVFSQRMFNYKLNILNVTESGWHGSKICKFKNLKTPHWLRTLKFKKYPFWRFDKIKNLQIIENGGWHFSYLQTPEAIRKKINSFSHGELLNSNLNNKGVIEKKIRNLEDIFDRKIKFKRVDLDESYPKYIVQNKNKFKEWII